MCRGPLLAEPGVHVAKEWCSARLAWAQRFDQGVSNWLPSCHLDFNTKMLGTTQPGFEPIRKPVEIDPGRAGYRIRDGDRFDRVDFQHRHRGRACEPVEEGLKANPQLR